jgi:hypothetical protein
MNVYLCSRNMSLYTIIITSCRVRFTLQAKFVCQLLVQNPNTRLIEIQQFLLKVKYSKS